MGTFAVLIILLAVVAASLRSIVNNKKTKKCGCGCMLCSGCPSRSEKNGFSREENYAGH